MVDLCIIMVYLCIQSHIVPKNPKKISGEVKISQCNIDQQGGVYPWGLYFWLFITYVLFNTIFL